MKKLFKLLLPLCSMFAAALHVDAQSVTTESISFKIEDVSELFMPPDLYMDIKFIDANGNDILEAEESGKIRLNISNKGGKADNVKVTVKPASIGTGISMTKTIFTTTVPKEGATMIEVPMTASINAPTGNARFEIKVSEPMGYDIDAVMELSTFAFQKSSLKMSGVSIVDVGKGLRALRDNPDGKIQKGEVVRASVLLQNVGAGEANGIRYKVVSRDPNVSILTESGPVQEFSGSVGNMLIEQTREISFRLSANNNYVNKGEYLPIYLTVSEEKGFGNIDYQQIPIPLDAVPVKPEVVKVKADTDKLMASLGTKVYSDDKRVTSDAQINDIMVAPFGEALYADAVAVVIGAENYEDSNIPQAPYAKRDAEVMKQYFKTSLGIPESDITVLTDEMVTSRTMKDIFFRKGLEEKVNPDKTDIFIYYSGHGVPMEINGKSEMFLIPSDCDKSYIAEDGISINTLYSRLQSLNARSVTVILDACFSGGSRYSGAYTSQNIAGHKMVMPDLSAMEQPWLEDPNFRVFTSSRGDQTSQGYDRSLSGLFTYYLATGLQGECDKDNNGTIMMSELVEYVTDNVNKTSGGSQTPQFYGNSDFAIAKIR